MNKQTDFDAIILVTASRWDQDYSSASISLAKELSKSISVFFIDNPFTLKDLLRGWSSPQIRRRIKSLIFGRSIYRQIAVTPLLVIPINWLPEGKIYNFFASINNKLFFIAIRRVIKDHKLGKYIYFNSYNPFYGYKLPADIKPAIKLYQSRDNISESDYVNKHGPRLETLAAQSADLRLATSSDLVKRLSTERYPFIFFPNAADFDLFNLASQPLKNLPQELVSLNSRPIIGYIGNLCLRLDYDLLYQTAVHFKDCTLLLVGPRNDSHYNHFNFDELENVVFVGARKIEELPQYLSVMDCAILPFKVNALTKSIYPLKINEYLAGGKPVVSTAFSPDIETFGDLVLVSETYECFLRNIEVALSDVDPVQRERRKDLAHKNSWKVRVDQFWNLIKTHQFPENVLPLN
jgi:teichuronic acid biosynthesis glycosyltransferase TuaH